MDNRFTFLFHYFKANRITGSVVLYIFLSVILKATIAVEIGIPCLWKMLFDFECPGCGITTALTHIVVLDFAKAYEANRLIFILLPATMSHVYFDFLKFKRIRNSAI